MPNPGTPIGGFIGLETADKQSYRYHDVPALSAGRACFRHILQRTRPDRVWLPYYVCDAVLQPLRELGIAYSCYRLDEALDILDGDCRPAERDLVLYVNYFGIKSDYVARLAAYYGRQLVVDDTQAFFQRGYPGLWSFNSARKFLGVPDGAYLYSPEQNSLPALNRLEPDYRHLVNRIGGDPDIAYQQFLAYEAGLSSEMLAVSSFSQDLLEHLDYVDIAARRRQNFIHLHQALGVYNQLNPELDPHDVPLYYPLLTEEPLRERLIKRRIFVPQLWPEMLTRTDRGYAWERRLASNLSPLPLDQRYNVDHMNRIITEITELLAP